MLSGILTVNLDYFSDKIRFWIFFFQTIETTDIRHLVIARDMT